MANVYETFIEVMRSISFIDKADRNEIQKFNFRGIDATMQVVGPALRDHGVFIVPSAVDVLENERYATARGGQMQGVIVRVDYTIFGPDGDSFAGSALGAAADAGDKAIPKAMSVAYRTFLLQALTVPTGDPDPDADTHERVDTSANTTPQPESFKGVLAAAQAKGIGPEAIKAIVRDMGYSCKPSELSAGQHAELIDKINAQ